MTIEKDEQVESTAKHKGQVSFARKAAKSGFWLVILRANSQLISWVITIFVARLLSPRDYGLMDMATMLTGYVAIFSEMGIGSAIVQKKDVTTEQVSSLFWFCLMTGVVFSAVCFGLSYPTVWIFKEPTILRVTQASSVLFIIGALMIVPYNLLMKSARFREIGVMNLSSVLVASLSMLWMASHGFHVWTLIIGTIILRSVNFIVAFWYARWRPTFHFRLDDIKPFLNFGFKMTGSGSLFYLFQKLDKFIVGTIFNAQSLGFYSFAMQLTSIPADKVVGNVQQISFPVFSKYQDDKQRIQDLYMRIVKYIIILITPLFAGGFFFGDEVVLGVLGEKWRPITFMFRMLCITQFVVSITEINNIVHEAQGRPHWTLIFNLAKVLLMPASLVLASKYGFNALVIPWLTVFPLIGVVWTIVTLNKIQIEISNYLSEFIVPFIASGIMIIGVKLSTVYLSAYSYPFGYRGLLIQEIIVGVCIYLGIILAFEKRALIELWNLRKQ